LAEELQRTDSKGRDGSATIKLSIRVIKKQRTKNSLTADDLYAYQAADEGHSIQDIWNICYRHIATSQMLVQ